MVDLVLLILGRVKFAIKSASAKDLMRKATTLRRVNWKMAGLTPHIPMLIG